MNPTKKIIIAFSILFGIVFFAMLLSFIPGDKIEFTNLPSDEDPLEIQNEDPVYGNSEGSIIIHHFGDLASESSAEMNRTLKQLADENSEIAIVWKDFPNTSLRPESWPAAIAARCAQKQTAFWGYQELLFSYNNELTDDLYETIAEDLDLGLWSFGNCIEDQKTNDWVEESYNLGIDLGITAAPTIFINGEPYVGTLSSADLERIISELILDM